MGWIYNNFTNSMRSRKAHTFELVSELRTSATLHRHRENIFSKLAYTSKLSEENLHRCLGELDNVDRWTKGVPLLESLKFLANLYDNISYGVRVGDFDMKIIEKTIRAFIVNFYEDYHVLVHYYNNNNPRALEHLIWLAEQFGAEDQTNIK